MAPIDSIAARIKNEDEEFKRCLLVCRNLTELKERISKISERIQCIVQEFTQRDPPKDIISLLNSLAICFTALLNALNFKEVDLKKLSETKNTFEKWKLDFFVMRILAIENFARGLKMLRKEHGYRSLEEIPKETENSLFQILKSSYLDNLDNSPVIVPIRTTDTEKAEKDWVRVCLVLLDFSLTKEFPWRLEEEEKVRKKVYDALEIAAKEEKADIICFPELSFAREWIQDIKSKYDNMIIICGSYYDENYNICPIIIEGKVYYYAKCYPSVMEGSGERVMKKGKRIFIFQTKKGLICPLVCIDFDKKLHEILDYVNQFNKPLNFIINPRCDMDREHQFQVKSSIVIDQPDGSRIPTFILHVNIAKWGNSEGNPKIAKWDNSGGGGGTAIICFEHNYRITKYIADGLRPRDEVKYKIFEAKDEMMLLADLNINANANIFAERTSVVNCNWYRHDGKEWVKLNDKRIW